jgi:hypothetical protein
MVGITMSGNFVLGRLKYDRNPAKVMMMVITNTAVLFLIDQVVGPNSFLRSFM